MFCTVVRLAPLFLITVLTACEKTPELGAFQPPKEKDYSKPLAPGQLALRKIGPERYPDFGLGFNNRIGLKRAVEYSLQYMAKPSSQKYFPYGDITHERAVRSMQHFLQVLDTAQSPQQLNEMIRRDFDVYESVGCDDNGTVFFTGYYTPIFEGRRQRDERFKYPLYRLPSDLMKDSEGNAIGRRRPDGGTDPKYPSRQEIEQGRLLDGLEIAYLKTPFEAYVITVQGSAKLKLNDGSIYELGYAGNNGYDYNPIAKQMIADGKIRREDLSLQTLLRYFEQHPGDVYKYAWLNPRYVFFKEAPGGPFGSIGVPVTDLRSIATDKQVFPRACVAFFSTKLPVVQGSQVQQVPYAAFACDQDTGGAIRAAGRCDIFMGIGPSAEAVAGRTGSEGHLYYIFIK